MKKYRIGIIGAAGYTAGELIRILVNHPGAELVFCQSTTQAGKMVYEVHQGLFGETELKFVNDFEGPLADIVFLCKGHGESSRFLNENHHFYKTRIIDLSQDFRLKGDHEFVYGLTELNRSVISESTYIANPGCFATSIQLALLPLANSGYLSEHIHISGITGSTGAGVSLSPTSHFSWRSNNASTYKLLDHQHLQEIGETLNQLSDKELELNFIPYRGAFTRGIITTSYMNTSLKQSELKQLYMDYYKDHPFTFITTSNPDLKRVVNTNKCMIFTDVINGKAVIVSVIDNLLKGASGQAVENMNLMMGFEQTTGLLLKASAF